VQEKKKKEIFKGGTDGEQENSLGERNVRRISREAGRSSFQKRGRGERPYCR